MNLNKFRLFLAVVAFCHSAYAADFDSKSQSDINTDIAINDKLKRLAYFRKIQQDKNTAFCGAVQVCGSLSSDCLNELDEKTSDSHFSSFSQSDSEHSKSVHISSKPNFTFHTESREPSLYERHMSQIRHEQMQFAREKARERAEAARMLESNKRFKEQSYEYLAGLGNKNQVKIAEIKDKAAKSSLKDAFDVLRDLETHIKSMEAEQESIQKRLKDFQATVETEDYVTYKYAHAVSQISYLELDLVENRYNIIQAKQKLESYRSRVEQCKAIALTSLLSDSGSLTLEELKARKKTFNDLGTSQNIHVNKCNRMHQSLKEDIQETESDLSSWGRWFNPWGKSSASLKEKLADLKRREHLEYVDYSEAKQNKEVTSLAIAEVEKLIQQKTKTLDWIAQEKAFQAQNAGDILPHDMSFVEAMESALKTGADSYVSQYNLTDSAKSILAKKGISSTDISNFTGNAVQQFLHDKFVNELNIFSALSTNIDNAKVEECIDNAVDLNLLGQKLNKDCHIEQAISLQSAANAVFEYAKSYLDFEIAITEGVLAATIETVDGIKSIAEFTHEVYKDPAKALEKIGSKLQQVKNTCTQAVLAVKHIARDPVIRSHVWIEMYNDSEQMVNDIYNTPARDKVKYVSKFATECFIQKIILNSAIVVGDKAIDMAKVAQRRSKDILVSAKAFLENPNTALIEEVAAALDSATTYEYMVTPDGVLLKASGGVSKAKPSGVGGGSGARGQRSSGYRMVKNANNRWVKSITSKEAEAAAAKLGFKKTNYYSNGKRIFKKENLYITLDLDEHSGGFWKMADSIKKLGNRNIRNGTYDEFLNRIGD